MSEQFSDRCPNCGWSDADEQDFLEHQSNFPEPPRCKRILRRVISLFSLADFYWMFVIYSLLRAFDSVLQSQGIESGFTILHPYLLFPAAVFLPLILFRALYDIADRYIQNRKFEDFLNTTTINQGEKS